MGFEKEINSLLRKLESKNRHGIALSTVKGKGRGVGI